MDYFDDNWLPITEQWVKFHVVKHHIFGNRTNNRLESLNQKLKAVIAKYSTMTTFVKFLLGSVRSMTIEGDIHVAEEMMRMPSNRSAYDDDDIEYSNILTNFAFQKYMVEKSKCDRVQFVDIDDRMAVSGPPSGRILTSRITCDCIFFTSM